jgi:hypothetical protein
LFFVTEVECLALWDNLLYTIKIKILFKMPEFIEIRMMIDHCLKNIKGKYIYFLLFISFEHQDLNLF